jgi:hypothetical protein
MGSQDSGAVDVHAGAEEPGEQEIDSGPEGAGVKPRWGAPTITTFRIGETLGSGLASGDGISNLSAIP